jgi:hypothetical protein
MDTAGIHADWPWWDDLHTFWCELPNYNPHSVQSSDPGFQHAADAAGLFSMPAGEDGDEDAPADGGSPGWNSRIGSDEDVDLLFVQLFFLYIAMYG